MSGASSALNVNFTPQAQDDLLAIRDWIAQDDDRAAERVISRIRQTVLMFEQFPLLGHPGDVPDTREFKVTGLPYLIVYRIASATDLDILTIIHSARKYP
jgi:toxin ParE1/3/4